MIFWMNLKQKIIDLQKIIINNYINLNEKKEVALFQFRTFK